MVRWAGGQRDGDAAQQRRGGERWQAAAYPEAVANTPVVRMYYSMFCKNYQTPANFNLPSSYSDSNLGRCEDTKTPLLPPISRTRKATVGWKYLAVVEAVIVDACIFRLDSSIDISFIADQVISCRPKCTLHYNHGPATGPPV